MNNPPILECKQGQTIGEAVIEAGYTHVRIGTVAHALPRTDEVQVAEMRVGHYSLPVPIFQRIQEAQNEQ